MTPSPESELKHVCQAVEPGVDDDGRIQYWLCDCGELVDGQGIGELLSEYVKPTIPSPAAPLIIPPGFFIFEAFVGTLESLGAKLQLEARDDLRAAGASLLAIAKLTKERPMQEVPGAKAT